MVTKLGLRTLEDFIHQMSFIVTHFGFHLKEVSQNMVSCFLNL